MKVSCSDDCNHLSSNVVAMSEQPLLDLQKKAHYQPLVQQIVEGWAVGKPPLPATGKPSGYYRLTNYLLDYLLANGALPTGIHAMPEGRDRNNVIEPSFPVDFDAIIDASLNLDAVGIKQTGNS